MPDFAQPFNALIAANNAPPPNPLATASQVVGLQNQVNQGRTIAAQADDAELANAANHVGMVTGALTTPLALGDKVRLSDVAAAGADLVASSRGKVSPSEIAQFVMTLPGDPQDSNAPNTALQAALRQHQLRLLNAQQQIDTLRGTNSFVNTGQKTQIVHTGMDGSTQVTGSMQNTLSPEAAATQVPDKVDKATGQKTIQPAGVYAEKTGLAAPGTYTGNDGGAIPVSISPTGRIIPQKTGATMGSAAAPPAGTDGFGSGTSATMPSTTMATEPSPGQSVALKNSADLYSADAQAATTYATQMAQLRSGLTALQHANTGLGTESRQAVASYLLALPGGVGQFIPGVNPDSIASFDKAAKYLTQAGLGTPNATRSDAGQDAALRASPSTHISNSAARELQAANIGFRRAQMANLAAFNASGQDPGQYGQFVANRAQTIDPRAFAVDLVPQSQTRAFMATLSPDEKVKFLASVRDAATYGGLDLSALGGAGGGQ